MSRGCRIYCRISVAARPYSIHNHRCSSLGRTTPEGVNGVALGIPSGLSKFGNGARRVTTCSPYSGDTVYMHTFMPAGYGKLHDPLWPSHPLHSQNTRLRSTSSNRCNAAPGTCPDGAVFTAVFIGQHSRIPSTLPSVLHSLRTTPEGVSACTLDIPSRASAFANGARRLLLYSPYSGGTVYIHTLKPTV